MYQACSFLVRVHPLIPASTYFQRSSVAPCCIAYGSTIRNAGNRLAPELGCPPLLSLPGLTTSKRFPLSLG
jgi:hypothetical protein